MNTEKDMIARDVAESEFERFVEAMDLDFSAQSMTKEDSVDFERLKQTVISAIMGGHLVVDEKGQPVLTCRTDGLQGTRITFKEPTGASMMATDNKGKHADVRKMFAMMADQTGENPGTFAKMKQRDLKICQALVTLFLA